jgi:hypothetical protein
MIKNRAFPAELRRLGQIRHPVPQVVDKPGRRGLFLMVYRVGAKFWHYFRQYKSRQYFLTAKMIFMNKILLSLLAGVAIGLIIAPDKGSETLRKLRDGLDDAKDKASDAAEDLWQKGSKAFRNAKSKFDEAI